MVTIEELNIHNHKLTDTTNVVMYLLQDRQMCDNDTCIHLLYKFLDSVEEHLSMVDSLYQGMLTDSNSEANVMAEKFMSGEVELKRIISEYTSSWCKKGRKELKINNYQTFSKDTQDLFDIVLSRIQDETEHLYPLVREIQKNAA